MSKARIKVKVKPKSKDAAGTIVASMPIAIVKNDHPDGKKLYETKARIITRIERGNRPKTTRLKRSR